jgi:hypothetical protein
MLSLSLPRFLSDLTVYMSNTGCVLLEAGTDYLSRATVLSLYVSSYVLSSVLFS